MKTAFEKWMEEEFDEPEWDEGWNRTQMELSYEAGRDEMQHKIQEALSKTSNFNCKEVLTKLLEDK